MKPQTVTLTTEEVSTAVAGMQFWAKSIDDYADRTDGQIAEHNRAEARRVRQVAAKLSLEWSENEYSNRVGEPK